MHDFESMSKEDESALNLLAAVRHPVGDELLRRLEVANRFLPWIKTVGFALGGIILFLAHAEYKINKYDDTFVAVGDNKKAIDNVNRATDKLDDRVKSIE